MPHAEAPRPLPHDPGLPPVSPPSGKFIVQLFLVPGLIVGVLACVVLMFQWLVGGPQTPEHFLKKLDSDNPEVRNRAAADLAQVLPRDAGLATDVDFALQLNRRLKALLDDIRKQEVAEARGELSDKARKALQNDREFSWFLAHVLGHFRIAIGAGLMMDMATDTKSPNAEAGFRRRVHGILALGTLGEKLKGFAALPDDVRARTLASLEAAGPPTAAALAEARSRTGGSEPSPLRVAEMLAEVARDEAPSLREYAAAALSVWDGPGAEDTLVFLLTDDSFRDEDPIRFDDQFAAYRGPSDPGKRKQFSRRNIRNAVALALAVRGSKRADDVTDIYAELLDVDRQMAYLEDEDPKFKSDREARVFSGVRGTLRALEKLRAARPDAKLPTTAIQKLTQHDNKTVRLDAKELLAKLK